MIKLLNGCKVLRADLEISGSETIGVVLADRGEQYGFERFVTWRVREYSPGVYDAHSGNYYHRYDSALNDYYERR